MTTKAISCAPIFPEAEAFELSFGEAGYTLDGAYQFLASGGNAEIELVDRDTLWRTVIYVKPGHDLVLFLPAACYHLYLRGLSDEVVRVDVRKMGQLGKLKFYATKAFGLLRRPPREGLQAIAGFLRRNRSGLPTAAQTGQPMTFAPSTVTRPVLLPASDEFPRKAVSIIIPTKERLDLLRACIDSLARIDDVVFEIIIVDNGAHQPAMLDYLAKINLRADVRVLRRDIPFNFSQLCNDGARLASNGLLLFLNDDVEALDGDWLTVMERFAAREDVGVVGARLIYPSGDLQHGGIASNLVPGPGHPWRAVPRDIWQSYPLLAQVGEVDAVTGACLMIKKDLFDTVGGFDADAFAVTLNDVDLCLRVRERGLKVVYVPQATLLHKEGQTRRADDHPQESLRYRRELAVFYRRHTDAAHTSVFYPRHLRRDGDFGLTI